MKVFDPHDDVVTELDGADQRTVTQLRDALAPIEFDHPIHAIVAAEPAVVGGRGRRRTLVKAAAAVAIVAGMIASNLGDNRRNVASAEWTPQSQSVTDLERAHIESACEDAARPSEADPAGTVTVPEIDDPGSDLPDTALPALALDPSFDGALIDRRGDIAAVVATTAEVSLECAARFLDGEWYVFATGVGWGGETTDPTVSSARGDDAEITMISGLAPNATSVEIDAPDLVSGTAPVIDGRYVLWLPTSDTWERNTTITVRSLDTGGAVLATVDISVDAPPR